MGKYSYSKYSLKQVPYNIQQPENWGPERRVSFRSLIERHYEYNFDDKKGYSVAGRKDSLSASSTGQRHGYEVKENGLLLTHYYFEASLSTTGEFFYKVKEKRAIYETRITKGEFIEMIIADEADYPLEGEKDGYWWVRGVAMNAIPVILLDKPVPNQTLYENDTLNVVGTVSDADNGNSITVRYQVNTSTTRAIKAFISDGQIAESFAKHLTFKNSSLYDGDTLIIANLTDGVPHTLKVWATDDQGGQSAIVERTFYVVPNRAPRLEVTPPTIEGNIDSDTFTVSGTYADDDKNEVIISYRINGSISKEVARGTDGAFDFTVSFAQLKNGNNTIGVEAIDSYGAKTSRTIKLNKNTIATPLLQSTVRYLIQPPKGSAQAVLLWLQRDQELAVTASLHMGMKGEAEAFTLLEPTNTAPLRDNAAILEDEFYHEADSAKDHIILQLDMKRSSVESTAAIHLISGVFE